MKSGMLLRKITTDRRRGKWLASAAMLLLAGCTALTAKLEAPRLSLLNIQVQDVSLFEQQMLVRLRVHNPNDLVLPVRGLDVDFDLEGEKFAHGVTAREFDVPAMGDAEFDMLVTADAARAVIKVLSREGRTTAPLHYRIRGTLKTHIGLLHSLPFDSRGTFSPVKSDRPGYKPD